MSTAPKTVTFKKVRKTVDWYYAFTLTTNGVAQDISGMTFFLRVADSANATILDLSLGNGLSFLTDGTDGGLLIWVDHLVIKDIPDAKYKYDLIRKDGTYSGVVMEGTVKFVDGVTETP